MKLRLAALPLEVWADVFLSPYQWINRQELAEFYNNIKNRGFARKLDKLLHDCGQQTLHYLRISNPRKPLGYRKIPEFRASLAVAHDYLFSGSVRLGADYKDCVFPENEMPENIKTFKRLTIKYLDDKVIDFLGKIKPLFTNVFIGMESTEYSASNMLFFFTLFLPMVGSIRGIYCNNESAEILARHFPETLTMAKELDLYDITPTFVPACLNWLAKPQDFDLDGPRFLKVFTTSETIMAIVDAVRQQFLTATSPSTFVILLQFFHSEQPNRAEEFRLENAATKEKMTAQNGCYQKPYESDLNYVEIVRNPAGANANMRAWIEKQRAYYEKKFYYDDNIDEDENKMIWITQPTIGQITKKTKAVKQDGNDSVDEEEEAGPSTSAAKK